MTTPVDIAITGFGSVGGGIADLILRRTDYYRDRYGVSPRIVGVCRSGGGLIEPTGLSREALQEARLRPGLTGQRFMDRVIADVLVESGPSDYADGGPGSEYAAAALARGVDVIFVSKGAMVVAGRELEMLAKGSGATIYLSAAAGAGLPVLDFVSECLRGAGLCEIEAVLTGTSAYVLDEMVRLGVTLEQALDRAQQLGIAEPDPRFDIDGWDTAAKLVILCQRLFGEYPRLEDVPRSPIRRLDPNRIEAARASGSKLALVGVLKPIGSGDSRVRVSVEIRDYPSNHGFSLTGGSGKGLVVRTAELGDFTLLGGASSLSATAAAALKDFEQILRTRAL